MKNWGKSFLKKLGLLTSISFRTTGKTELQHIDIFQSTLLQRQVQVDIYLPPHYYEHPNSVYPVLFFNDGQDLETAKLLQTLDQLYTSETIPPLIVVGIFAGDRIQEYGTAHHPDYKNRGSKAALYQQFLFEELFPFIHRRYRCSEKASERAFAGFSLGALAAFDLVWNHPTSFGIVGVFSGSLWWRSKAFQPENPDANRIVHDMVRSSPLKPGLRFWFQAGTDDEQADRNNNGIIDAIDDTLHLMELLAEKGYQKDKDMTYHEVEGGIHHPSTWGQAMPHFLKWAFAS